MLNDNSSTLGLFPLELVVLPGEIIPLHIFESRYQALVTDRVQDSDLFGIVNGTDGGYTGIGCAVHLEGITQKFPDGRLNIITRGYRRIVLREKVDQAKPYLCSRVEWFDDDDDAVSEAVIEEARTAYREVAQTKDWGPNLAVDVANDAASLSWSIAIAMDLSREAKQNLIEMSSAEERLTAETRWLSALLLGESE